MITEILQKAVITVDEVGMEAAAATAAIAGTTAAPVRAEGARPGPAVPVRGL